MDITALIIIVLAICGLVWVYPRLPRPGQIVAAIVVAVVCILVILKFAGVDVHF